ncbi:MAG: hypothetical protein HS111_33160 [Kofleriaceae bacterium]|nr:hypothetical protein [Kofleriaceae bacterium]
MPRSAVAAQLWARLAVWHRDRRGDRDAAVAAFKKSLAAGGDRADTLRALAELLRGGGPSAQLLDVLRRLSDADPRDQTSWSRPPTPPAGSAIARRRWSLGQVLGRAARRVARLGRGPVVAAGRGGGAVGDRRPGRSAPRAGRPQIAVDLARRVGAPLPFDADTRRDLRMRAAAIASSELRDNAAAIDMYRGATTCPSAAGDPRSSPASARLLEAERRHAELLGLRHVQLGLEPDPARRLELRLDIARLVGVVEETGGRYEALIAATPPISPATTRGDRRRPPRARCRQGPARALADLLEEQAGKRSRPPATPPAPPGAGPLRRRRRARRSGARARDRDRRATAGP